jgi:signal transduction histidine kinase/DNA-binding response OmpR family regulator/HAMP domain-containing protein
MTTFSTMTNQTKIRLSFFHSLRAKLILLFLLVSLLPLITLGVLAYTQTNKALKQEVTNKLVAVRDIKANQISKYFEERLGDLKVLGRNPNTIAALHAFSQAVESDIKTSSGKAPTGILEHYRSLYLNKPNLASADDGSTYSVAHAQYHPWFKEYLEVYGYYDIFLVEPHQGNILYTMAKENDFGTSLVNGLYANTNLGEVFKEVSATKSRDFSRLQDFAYYEPSKGAAAFEALPIFDNSELVGVLIFQLSIDQIDAIMQEHSGLGATGETLLVSADDFLLRSNSRFVKESTLFKLKLDHEVTRAAAAGDRGVKTILDTRHQAILIAYKPLAIPGVRWLLLAQQEEAEAFAVANHLLTLMVLVMVVIVVIIASVAVAVGNSIVKPLLAVTAIARQLAAGKLNQTIEINSRDEIGLMSQAFQEMISNLRLVIEDMVKVSQGLATGNLLVTPQATYQGDFILIKKAMEMALSSLWRVIEDLVQVSQGLAAGNLRITVQAEYQGDFVQIKNALETSLANLRQVIEDSVQVLQELAQGNLQVMPKAEYNGEFVQLKEALAITATKLTEATSKNLTQNWLKTGQMQLSMQMSGEQELVKLAKTIITFLATYLEMPVGLFYLLEGQEGSEMARLKLIASYAYTHRKGLSSEFLIGEGIVGQVALERKPILLTKVPDHYYIHIQSGLGKSLPRQVLLQPFLYEDTLKGVIELAAFKPITELQQEFLTQVMSGIGIAVNTAQSRSRLQELLQQSQTQTEELQSQAEELQSQTEELQSQQEELTQINEELQERTKELERQKEDIRDKNAVLEKTQQVIEAKAKEVELASKYKSEFLANMSHELRTPLNSMLILAQLLAENKAGNLTNKQLEYAQTIQSAGVDLLKLINDILDLSKIEAGRMEVNLEDVSLSTLVEAFEKKFRPVADSKGLAFHITTTQDLPPVLHTDDQRLQQIINNLLSNAFKFTSQGGVTLTISKAERQNFSFAVTDTGIGIPKDKQEIIFEAFQQVDGTTSRRFGGTGLGLSISRELANLLGGKIRLHSEAGKGSTFTLYLPDTLSSTLPGIEASQVAEATSKVAIPSATAHVITTSPTTAAVTETVTDQEGSRKPTEEIVDDRQTLKLTDKSLLIIEDDWKFSRILMEIAHEKHFQCLLAEDGQTGLQLATQYQPTAIIMDIGLPKMDGGTVMEKLKDNPQTRHIPVHFVTASDQQKREVKKMGAIGYLLKPVTMEQLGGAFKKIETFIAKSVKSLLVVVDNEARRREILELVDNKDVKVTQAATRAEAFQYLQTTPCDCIILDVDVEQRAGFQLLEQLCREESLSQIPVIIYTAREVTPQEEMTLHQYESNLTVKLVRSPERLLEEATLFLHQVESRLPKEKRNILQRMYNKEAILKSKKILIVDDDTRNTFALLTVLEDKGMEVIVGNNGQEALELLNQHPDIDLVLMDIMMPEMDGYEATQKIRAQEHFRKLPVIALTAKAMKGDKAKCIEAGANDYLSKPVDIDKLISLMRVWLYR